MFKTIWILVIISSNYHVPALRFTDEISCEKAKQQIIRDFNQGLKDRTFCFEVINDTANP